MDKIGKIIIILLVTCIVLMLDNTYLLGTFYFYILFAYLIFDIIIQKTIKLIHVWSFAFIFVILSEVFISIGENVDAGLLAALKFLIIANNIILIGYLSNSSRAIKRTVRDTGYKSSAAGSIILIVFTVAYVAMTINNALTSFALGRQSAAEGDNFVLSSIISSMGFLLPSVCLFYFYSVKKTSILVPILFALPVFIILFMGGSRFPLLFSFLGFVITYQSVSQNKFSVKNLAILAAAGIILLSASIAMKTFRGGTMNANIYGEEEAVFKDIPTYFSQFMSNEGVIDMTSLMIQHFSTNNHLYGSSTSFIIYFWVPRELWADKPTMLGYWFIRQYRGGFGEGHSASFGFTGDLFADFGYFSLLLIFFIGRAIKTAENFQKKAFASTSYSVILGAMLYPYVFFFVRSPITATMMFLGILFFYYLFKKILFRDHVTKF
ncbi:MAG TPA: hypothetical protein DCW95_00930 [Chryseobacterium sp.]|nr:hypothetical protein [Chryseobacterium sp.]